MLEIISANKQYGSAIALRELSLEAAPGRVTGIAGPNGAGKSTLVKIIAGETALTSGIVRLWGVERSQRDLAAATAVVHQEPHLYPTLTVADNLLVGRKGRFLRPRIAQIERDLLDEFDLTPFANLLVKDVPIAIRQRAEIVRALARDSAIFLFDEPNSALTEDESQDLFSHVHALAKRSKIVLFVSHRLRELADVSGEVVIVKDGRVTRVLVQDELSESALAAEMAGPWQPGETTLRSEPAAQRETGLVVRDWRVEAEFDVGELDVSQGEIIAVLGVEGSGGREFVSSLAGFANIHATGEMLWDGERTNPGRLTTFVPASRQESVFATLTVGACLVSRLPPQSITGWFGLVDQQKSDRIAAELISRFSVRCDGPAQNVSELSGGNQQKVVIASALAADPKVVIVEEPTRGVDIRSRAEIYALLRQFVSQGRSAVLFCTEEEEAFEVADKCLVFSRGMVAGCIDRDRVNSPRELIDAIADLENKQKG